jgi:hypothetical protein
MPPNSEIEKLERRWKENPKGTVFAPYAEVLRKHGDYPLAKEVLRQGLELHPDHIPGNIVLGRCCLDLGEDGPAEAAFVHVLDLDVENVIALKALADVTERQGRLMESANWLARLIAVDPSNDEARDQLARVDTAREAASAAMVAPPPPPAPETTEVRTVIQPPTPAALEPTRAPADPAEESHITTGPVGAIDADAAVEAALGGFGESSTLSPPPPPSGFASEDVTERVPTRPLPASESMPMADLVPGGLDLAEIAHSIESQDIAGLSPDEPFQAPPSTPPLPEVYGIGLEDAATIDLQAGGGSEFQSADDSTSLDFASGSNTEFQQPNPAEELRPSDAAGLEYQSASGADDLLKTVQGDARAASPPDYLEPPPPPPLDIPTSGFAAIALMPTEELPTGETPEPVAPLELESDSVPAQSVVEMLAAASEAPSPPPAEIPVAEAESGTAPAGGRDLHLIFPDDSPEPEPPRVRRITEEIGALGERESAESAVKDPEPVLTETMAELYAQQGHLAEALNVYRVLSARTPDDARLAERIRELERAQSVGGRRMSYVAVDTGGESVESFFRSLSDARPDDPGEAAPHGDDSGSGRPTRPASSAVSLSAIFGEDGSGGGSTNTGEAPARQGNPDSFSFDQFFGGSGGSSSSTGPRQAMPSDEDLDQFQNWLKSLKR